MMIILSGSCEDDVAALLSGTVGRGLQAYCIAALAPQRVRVRVRVRVEGEDKRTSAAAAPAGP